VAGLSIDNLVIETTSMEIPEPQDGSAAPFARLLMDAGFEEQDRPKRHIECRNYLLGTSFDIFFDRPWSLLVALDRP